NTSLVSDMGDMFFLCSDLQTIYASDNFSTEKVSNGVRIFSSNTKLVGGSGTTYNASYIDKTYAHIDGGTSNPGYFTRK
ncbi:MAG: hypothetical protein IKF38_03615, partial [Clostridia bacterium]|nr:hypothetical protein [Clostridia bacterium]